MSHIVTLQVTYSSTGENHHWRLLLLVWYVCVKCPLHLFIISLYLCHLISSVYRALRIVSSCPADDFITTHACIRSRPAYVRRTWIILFSKVETARWFDKKHFDTIPVSQRVCGEWPFRADARVFGLRYVVPKSPRRWVQESGFDSRKLRLNLSFRHADAMAFPLASH